MKRRRHMPANVPRATPAFDSRVSFATRAILAGLFTLALAVRLPVMYQSLWYDEMYTLIHYISHSTRDIVAGHFSRNNHILFTLLAKAVTPEQGPIEWMIRVPSLLAGALLAPAIAWPLRSSSRLCFIGAGLVAALHPWAISFSGWARGYSLLLLLVVLATNALPRQIRPLHLGYTLLMSAAIYTQPIAVLLFPAHALAIFLTRRKLLGSWAKSAGAALLLSAILYSPFLLSHAKVVEPNERPSLSYPRFLLESAQHATAGHTLSNPVRPIATLVVIGVAAAWVVRRQPALVPMWITFATASILALLMPLAVPITGESRALFWLIPFFCISVAVLLETLHRQRPVAAILAAALICAQAWDTKSIWQIPTQPIREAVELAKSHASGPVIGIYLGADEARAIYGGIDLIAYRLNPDPKDPNNPALLDLEKQIHGQPTVIIFYSQLMQRDQPDLWAYVQKHYKLIQTLPGRTAPAAIYETTTP